MPTRLLREGILTSEPVNSLSTESEVFYRRLQSVVDDFGRYTAHPALLRAALYPLQLDRVREASMERHLADCEKARLVRLYVHEGKRYLELLKFRQVVRAKESKWPEPPNDAEHQHSISDTDATLMRSETETESKTIPQAPEGRDGKRAAAEERAKLNAETFAAFWAVYPNKVCKVPAEKAWVKHGCAALAESIIQAVERAKRSRSWRKDDGQFIPHPATWLNHHRWKDEGVSEALPPDAPKPIGSMSAQIAAAREATQ